jgi:hypothetical protein
MMRTAKLASVLATLALAACGSYGGSSQVARGVPPLAPQPTSPVVMQPLPAPTAAPTDVAIAEPGPIDPSQALPVGKADLSGGWKIASAGETCQLFMNLTTWTGGYRANTRGCGSDELKAVGAWDLSGKEVVLKDASGSPIARLYASAPGRFSGQTEISKRGVQIFR